MLQHFGTFFMQLFLHRLIILVLVLVNFSLVEKRQKLKMHYNYSYKTPLIAAFRSYNNLITIHFKTGFSTNTFTNNF